MTKEEFNKLSKQARIDLVWDKWRPVFSCDAINPTHNIQEVYARHRKTDAWKLVAKNVIPQINFIQEIAKKYFESEIEFITATNEIEKLKLFAIKAGNEYIHGDNDLGNDFLEELYFTEQPKGKTIEYFADEFESMTYLNPQWVYLRSRQMHPPMSIEEYVKKSRENGDWLIPKASSIFIKS